MRAATRARRWPRWLRSGLSLCVLASVLVTLLPHVPTYAAPDEQGGGGLALPNVCREPAPPLVQTYVDRPDGFSLQYPDGWIFRPRSGGLPGTRSDVVWFGPDPARARTPSCLFSVRLAMHYLMSDATLEDMRDMTAMLEPPSLITRALQVDVAATPTPPANAVLGDPNVKLPPFWGALSRNNLWGAERLTLPSGQPYYREIGAGPVQDLEGNENQGNITRYVIAVSPRVMLEIVGQATVPEFEAQYGRLFDQMVQAGLTLQDVPATSTNPGPVGTSATPGDCQGLFLLNQLSDRDLGESPFLERSAVTLRLSIRGAVVPYDPVTRTQCPGAISRVGIFLDEPPAREQVQDVSVYGLPVTVGATVAPGIDLSGAGYYLSWTLPTDLYGQRVVYIGAQMPDGRWSYVTRQINVAPPLSVEIATSPRQVDIGSPIMVTMRVFNNTGSRITAIRPVLYPEEGPGTAILRTGPTYLQGACDFSPRATSRTTLQQLQGGTQPPGQPLAVSLEPYTRDNTSWCALFVWTFTALRSGSLSFTGTAEGRLAEAPSRVRLLSLLGDTPGRLGQAAGAAGTGDQISAPIATAADTQVRPPEFQVVPPSVRQTDLPITVLRDWDNPTRVEVWTLVRNNGTSDIYNVGTHLNLQGVNAQIVGTGYARGVLLAGTQASTICTVQLNDAACLLGCPSVTVQGVRPSNELQPGDTIPALRQQECAAFMTAFQLDPNTREDQPFAVVGRITANTRHSGSLDLAYGESAPQTFPEQTVNVGGFSLATLRRQDLTPAGTRLGDAIGSVRGVPVPGAGQVTNPPPDTGGPPSGAIPLFGPGGATGQYAAVAGAAVGAAVPSVPCPSDVDATPVPGSGISVRVRASLLRSPEAIVFQLGDTVRVVTEVRNCTDQSLFNVQIANLIPSGTNAEPNTVVDLFPLPSVGQQAGQQQQQALQAQQDAIQAALASGLPISAGGLAPPGVVGPAGVQPAAGAAAAPGQAGTQGAAAAPAQGAAAGAAGLNIQQAQQQAAVQAAANAAAAGASAAGAQAAASRAAQAVAGVTVGGNFCGPSGLGVRNNIPNEIRLLNGPNPVAIDRLPPDAIASFISDYLVGDVRDQTGTVTFDASVQGLTGDGTLEQGRSTSFSIERFTGCMYMTALATPDTLTSGDVVEIKITGMNVPLDFPPRAFRDVFPQSLRVLRESGALQFQLLSGPFNPVSSLPISVGQDEGATWTWRYRVTGSGCFRARGQFSAVVLGRLITTNNAETNQVCVVAPPRPPAVPATAR